MAFLSFEGIVAGYGGGDVLKGVNFTVREGGVTCIVGPNGSGKSTLLKTVSGLLRPRLGQIVFKGTPLVGRTPRQILKMGVVQVPQQHSLFKEMTVEENVTLGAFLVRDRSEVSRRLDSVREMFPIVSARAKDKAGSLSGGQQRLVEFARCLMLEPELVVLDEPSMGLDPKTLRSMFDTVKLMNEMGRTVLLVEQNARQALKLSHHGVVLENGQVRLMGTGKDVLNNPEIGALYLGLLPRHAPDRGHCDKGDQLMAHQQRVGWIGCGRMGSAMAKRLIAGANEVVVTNRTRSKAEALGEFGASVVDNPMDLAQCAVVFMMVSADAQLLEVLNGPHGVLANEDVAPRVVIDCSTVSTGTSATAREACSLRGVDFLAAPVSGNPKVVASGKLTLAVSGSRSAFDEVRPLLDQLGHGVTYVGEGEVARLVKICHNMFLGVVTQAMAEITVLAERGGIERSAFLEFLNDSVMGSAFTRYKTPAFVNLE